MREGFLRVRILGSGSSGNAVLVMAGRCRLLVEAGVAASRVEAGCRAEGFEAGDLAAVLISHDHADHAGNAPLLSRRHKVPVICSEAAEEGLARAGKRLSERIPLEPFTDLGDLTVVSFPVPHDVTNHGFRFEADGARVGMVTDLGSVTEEIVESLWNCDVLIVEANHDTARLHAGPYPPWLKQRILSPTGHLSNHAAAMLAAGAAGPATRRVVLAHLSWQNNDPATAQGEVRGCLRRAGRWDLEVDVASRRGLPTPLVP